MDKFNKEQDAFIKSQGGAGGSGQCPWEGHQAADKIKEEIMTLSAVSIQIRYRMKGKNKFLFENKRNILIEKLRWLR